MQPYKTTVQCSGTRARTGELKTAHGIVKTPFFMPVATLGTVKYISPTDLKDMGFEAAISNAMLFDLKPGAEFIKNHGGLHKFTGFDRTIFADSGGFQVIRTHLFKSIDDRGVHFKSPYDGRKTFVSPEIVMRINLNLGSDVVMALDHMPDVLGKKEEIGDAVRRTHLWAERCKKMQLQLHEKKQLLFGICQGGVDVELRTKSAEFIDKLDFDGIAIGGLGIGETKKQTYFAVDTAIQVLNPEKPRYLMGIGDPPDLLEAISHGADCFDSIFPTKNGRHGHVFTKKGFIKLDRGEFRGDERPIEPECGCFVCKNHSRMFLHHLMKVGSKTALRLMSYHNLYFINNLMKEVRAAIKEDRFQEYKKEFLAGYVKKK
ncbi:MAG: tRNA guanosine(34) transglycosylase Tgt [Nanoarchaeota archaeon]|nr:tRNA guanosine(34) transglycosylase Tgt [Nanoarchaeota archaeon]